MSLRDTLRGRVCQFGLSPDYPLGDFIKWTTEQGLEPVDVLHGLDELQAILNLEAEALQRHGNANRATRLEQQRYWCLYCERIRAHFRALLPQSKHDCMPCTPSATQSAQPGRAFNRMSDIVTIANTPENHHFYSSKSQRNRY